MGRVHRANQRTEPELVLVTTNLKAQRRFLSTIARRLDQLGALTKGQRQTTSQGLLSSEFNLETPLSRASLHNWFVDVYHGGVPGVTMDVIQEQMGLRILCSEGQLNLDAIPSVPKFLNRLLSLRTDVMDTVFDSWHGYLQEALEAAREAGKLDVEVEMITAEQVKKDEALVLPAFARELTFSNEQAVNAHPISYYDGDTPCVPGRACRWPLLDSSTIWMMSWEVPVNRDVSPGSVMTRTYSISLPTRPCFE